MKNIAVILASGIGKRAGFGVPKQFMNLGGKTVLEHSIGAFENNSLIDEIIVVSHSDYKDYTKQLIKKALFKKVSLVVCGGETRKDSSYNGITAIKESDAKVLIHDAVRPFVTDRMINDCIKKLDEFDAVTTAVESVDTLVKVNDNIIESIPKRSLFRRVQTPQGFKLNVIKQAHYMANQSKDFIFTDDCGLVQHFELCQIAVVQGDEKNIKITYPNDIKIAELINQERNS